MSLLDTGNLGLNQLCHCINYKLLRLSLLSLLTCKMVAIARLHPRNVYGHLVNIRHASRRWEVGRGLWRANRSWPLLLGSLHPREECWEHRETEADFCSKGCKENQTGWCDRNWWEKEGSKAREQTADWWLKGGDAPATWRWGEAHAGRTCFQGHFIRTHWDKVWKILVQHQTQQMEVTQQMEATIMIQRTWGNSQSQGMRKPGEGVTRTSGRKLKPKGWWYILNQAGQLEQRSHGRPVKDTRTDCRAQAPSRRSSGDTLHFPRLPRSLWLVLLVCTQQDSQLTLPKHLPPIPGRSLPIWPGLLGRRWANKSDSIRLISCFIDEEAGAQGGDKILMGNTAPLSNLNIACASLNQEGCLFPPRLSLCLSYSSRDGMKRAAGERVSPAQPANPGSPWGHWCHNELSPTPREWSSSAPSFQNCEKNLLAGHGDDEETMIPLS